MKSVKMPNIWALGQFLINLESNRDQSMINYYIKAKIINGMMLFIRECSSNIAHITGDTFYIE